jgi:hexokinase
MCLPTSRVCAVQLHGDRTFSLHQKKYLLSDALKSGEASTLFGMVHSIYHQEKLSPLKLQTDYLADSVDAFLTSPEFLKSQESTDVSSQSGGTVHLGFTFSYPMEQVNIASGILLTWTKGFSTKNAVGKDAVKLLQDAFDRKHMHVKCVAIVNDVCHLAFLHCLL